MSKIILEENVDHDSGGRIVCRVKLGLRLVRGIGREQHVIDPHGVSFLRRSRPILGCRATDDDDNILIID